MTGRVPPALRTPTARVGLRFQLLLGSANLGACLAFQPMVVLLLPSQVRALSPARTATDLAIVMAAGAVVGLVSNVLIGALSDRTTSRFGRRRPWIGAGAAMTVVGLRLMAGARGIGTLAVSMMVVSLGVSAMSSGATAVVPDLVPERQRGVVSGIVGIGIPLSLLLGSILVGMLIEGTGGGYAALVLGMLALVAPFVLTVQEPVLEKGQLPRRSFRDSWRANWTTSLRNRDFGIAWATRFLVVLGYAMGVGSFLFLYVQNVLHYETLFPGRSVKEGVAILMVIATSVLLPVAILSGLLSDHVRRRKVFVTTSSLLIAIGFGFLGFFRTWTMAKLAAVVVGSGFGAYVAVDSALITQVLPSPATRGRDLGIINVANALPDVIAPPLAAALINVYGQASPNGYRLVFGLAAALMVVGAIFVRGIRSVA